MTEALLRRPRPKFPFRQTSNRFGISKSVFTACSRVVEYGLFFAVFGGIWWNPRGGAIWLPRGGLAVHFGLLGWNFGAIPVSKITYFARMACWLARRYGLACEKKNCSPYAHCGRLISNDLQPSKYLRETSTS
jgi:hypothetical protein